MNRGNLLNLSRKELLSLKTEILNPKPYESSPHTHNTQGNTPRKTITHIMQYKKAHADWQMSGQWRVESEQCTVDTTASARMCLERCHWHLSLTRKSLEVLCGHKNVLSHYGRTEAERVREQDAEEDIWI